MENSVDSDQLVVFERGYLRYQQDMRTSVNIMWISLKAYFDKFENIGPVHLFVLLLYVPSQQLWSLQDSQFT